MDIRKVAKAVVARDEDRGYSVGFDITIDPEQLDELEEASDGDVNALIKLYAEAAKEVGKLFDNPVSQQETSEYGVSADFKHWVTDLQKFADTISRNDDGYDYTVLFLANGLEAKNFHAVKGHWGQGATVDYENWDEEFGIELA